MRCSILTVVAVPLLAGCAHSIEYTCSHKFGFEQGSDQYQSCFGAQTQYRQTAQAQAKARGDAINRAMWQAVAVGVATYGESLPVDQPSRQLPRPGFVICPDGQWQAGSRCVITPDGRWVGVQ